ncbi:zinc transporter ZntB [Falsihalocynthiibacter sp. S25ZX9]|uniref:zinc transporter ZntB n=1 Tax=unclassified Falsihalocynthiibacter TaxID=2854191 RepID=UPI00350F9C91
MLKTSPKPICAFNVSSEGGCERIVAPLGPKIELPATGYLWLHFDLNDANLEAWIEQVLPRTAARALLQPETRPRCDRLEDGMILTLRGVNLNPGADPNDMVSVRLWIQEGLIVSARARKIWAVDAIRQKMETGVGPESIGAFLAELTYGLTKRIEKVSLDLVEGTDAVEDSAMSQVQRVSGELSALRHSVIKIRRFVRPQTEAIADLSSGSTWTFEPHQRDVLKEVANRAVRTMEELDATSDRLHVIQEHLDMLHATTLGRNSYVLSVVAAIFLPLGFLTGLFGINVGGMPGLDSRYGFLAVTGGSAFLGLVLYAVFRRLKWL